jgi:RHS repeat-associated protein
LKLSCNSPTGASFPDVLQECSYYPYGLTFDIFNGQNTTNPDEKRNRYLFNGIEFTEDLELNLYGMFYRQYDPQLGRWTGVDPIASDFPLQSPYLVFDGNPVLNTDPDGRFATNFLDKDGKLITHVKDGSNAEFKQTNSGLLFSTNIVKNRVNPNLN